MEFGPSDRVDGRVVEVGFCVGVDLCAPFKGSLVAQETRVNVSKVLVNIPTEIAVIQIFLFIVCSFTPGGTTSDAIILV